MLPCRRSPVPSQEATEDAAAFAAHEQRLRDGGLSKTKIAQEMREMRARHRYIAWLGRAVDRLEKQRDEAELRAYVKEKIGLRWQHEYIASRAGVTLRQVRKAIRQLAQDREAQLRGVAGRDEQLAQIGRERSRALDLVMPSKPRRRSAKPPRSAPVRVKRTSIQRDLAASRLREASVSLRAQVANLLMEHCPGMSAETAARLAHLRRGKP